MFQNFKNKLNITTLSAMFSTFFKGNILLFVLLIVITILCFKNYTPDTHLTGWDTLHPEFNYSEYFKRMIDGAWQEHQGLGAVASQAHASELPRVLTLLVFDIFLPTQAVRYAYAFFMLFLGPIGVYFLTKRYILSKTSARQQEFGAFFAALFYLLNIVTMQHFYIPLEMFLTHYGYLGFFMFFTVKFLKDANYKNLLYFIIVSFLMAPQAHTSTLFFALVLNWGLFLLFYVGLNKFSFSLIKRAFVLGIVLLITNLFWLLPNIYFIVNGAKRVQESKIHRLFNEEAILQNKAYGTVDKVSIGQGYLFNWGEYVGYGQFGDLLNEWSYHLEVSNAIYIGYILTFLVFLGFLYAVFSKNKVAISIVGFTLVSFFFLVNVNNPTGFIYIFLENNLPLFKEAFRFHFTKFSITYIFSYAIFFGLFIASLFSVFNKLKSKFNKLNRPLLVNVFTGLVFILFFTTLIYYAKPMFNGYLISPSMRVKIPDRYFEMFEYFDQQDKYGRVANLPIQSFWGWVYHNWNPTNELGYQGAGFLWFGIKQPLLDREFDRWNITNQNYYNDMTRAVYAQDPQMLIEVLEKYKIRYILHDKSIIAPGHNESILFIEEIDELLANTANINLIKDFGQGLRVYEYTPIQDYSIVEYTELTSEEFQKNTFVKDNSVTLSEQIEPSFINSNENEIIFELTDTVNYVDIDYITKVPFTVSLIQDAPDSISLQFKTNHFNKDLIFTEPLPIKSSSDGSYILYINNSPYVISANTLNTDLGTIYFNPNNEHQISLYDLNPDSYTQITNIEEQLEVCSDVGSASAYSLVRLQNGFILTSKNATPCLTTSISNQLQVLGFEALNNQVLLLDVSGEYIDEPCIFDQNEGLCTNIYVSDTLSVTPIKEVSDLHLRFYTKNTRNFVSKENKYENIQLQLVSPAFKNSFYLDSNLVNELSSTSLKNNLVFNKIDRFSKPANKLISQANYCITKEPYQDNSNPFNDNTIKYSTDDLEICDSFDFSKASHQNGYILEINASNIEGIPLRVCLTNEYSKRCDKYIELDTDVVNKSHYYFVPSIGEKSGYTVNISNLAFAGETTTNELHYIGLTPVPYDLLMNVYNSPENANENALPVVRYNQAFNEGWVALCGLSLCEAEHVWLDSWANGWVFNKGDIENVKDVRIIFLPQLSEYLGFLMLFLLVSYVFIRIIQDNKKSD